jgi:hypothetical protein
MHHEREDCRTLQRSLQLLSVSPSASVAFDRTELLSWRWVRMPSERNVGSATAATLPRRVPRASSSPRTGLTHSCRLSQQRHPVR